MATVNQVGNLVERVDDTDGYFLGSKFYIPGGIVDDSTNVDTVQAFDPSDGSTTVEFYLPEPRGGTAVAPDPNQGNLYMFGGNTDSDSRTTDIIEVDPANDSAGKVADLSDGRSHHTAVYNPDTETIFCWGGKASGSSDEFYDKAIEEFDPSDNSVRTVGYTNPTYKDQASVYLNGDMYQIGGDYDSDSVTSSVYKLTASGGYTEVGTLTFGGDPYEYSTTRASQVEGDIYTFGGAIPDDTGYTIIDKIFRFSTDWELTEIGQTAQPIEDAIPAVNPSTGKVYNAGGANRNLSESYGEIYEVGAGSGTTKDFSPGNLVMMVREDLAHL